MRKKNVKIENIVGIFTIMLLASIFIMPVSAQSLGIPIKLELTAKPSTITVGETSMVTVKLLDENDKTVVAEVDIPVNLSTNLGYVPSSMVIPAGTNISSTKFKSEVPGVAVILVKSKGLISDTTSIAVVPLPTPTPTVTGVGPVTTTFRVHYDVGWGDNIAIRGSIPQLNNWEAPGKVCTWTEGNVWVYETTDIPEGTEFEWKPLINDEHWSVNGNYKGVGGQTMDEYPVFEKIPGVEVTPTSVTPRPGPTPVPGFEAVLMIIGLLTVTYLIRRREY